MKPKITIAPLTKIEAAEQEIARREKEIQDLRDQLEILRTEPTDLQLARELHDMLCTWNHTDGCGWFYEFTNNKDDWSADTHGRYLTKARNLISQCEHEGITADQALKVYRMVKGS